MYHETQQAQAGELSTTNSEILPDKNGGPQESGGTQESGEEQNNIGGNLEEGGADPSSLDQDDQCAKIDNNDNGPLEGQQATAGGGEASSALGDGISSSTLASTTGSRGGQQEDTTRSELLTGGLAVAVSGHWRAAEQQFEETARRVRKENSSTSQYQWIFRAAVRGNITTTGKRFSDDNDLFCAAFLSLQCVRVEPSGRTAVRGNASTGDTRNLST